MQEIVTGLLMAFDVVALYLLAPHVKSKFLLAFWTAALHTLFPLIGFQFGEWMHQFIANWANTISCLLIFFVGLQLLLSPKNKDFPAIPMPVLAILSSIDTFSVSLSFGMLSLQKYLFVISAGVGTFILSYISLYVAQKTTLFQGHVLKWIAGATLIIISIISI